MITEEQYQQAARTLGVDVATIKAVTEVESGGKGFLKTGEPVILFEPHVFWRELRNKGINPSDFEHGNEDILYPEWGMKPYGLSTKQHGRLARAVAIDRDSALKSASWGMFQIMGNNYRAAGYPNVQGFVNAMYHDEGAHLQAFVNFIKYNKLDRFLKIRDWAGFALRYNGKGYKKNKYDIKLAQAYNKYK